MSDQINAPVEDGDEDDISFRFDMRNMHGTSDTLQIQSAILGTGMFLLMQPGDGQMEVTTSHMDREELVGILLLAASAMLTDPDLADDLADTLAREAKGIIDDAMTQRAGARA